MRALLKHYSTTRAKLKPDALVRSTVSDLTHYQFQKHFAFNRKYLSVYFRDLTWGHVERGAFALQLKFCSADQMMGSHSWRQWGSPTALDTWMGDNGVEQSLTTL